VVTNRNAILFQLVYSPIYRSVYFCVSNCNWNYKPSAVCKRGFSLSVISCEKIMTSHCSQPVMTYIYLCERISASCLFSFSNHPSVMDQKLNWNVTQAFGKPFTIGILSYTDSWCLVPFSSNVSGDSTHKVGLCFGSQESNEQYISH